MRQDLGFFWDVTSGEGFRIQYLGWFGSGYTFTCQCSEACGQISQFSLRRWTSDPGVLVHSLYVA